LNSTVYLDYLQMDRSYIEFKSNYYFSL